MTFDLPTLTAWGGFLAFVLGMLFFDLLVLHRNPHEIKFREALLGVAIPVGVALAFTAFIYCAYQYDWLELGVLSHIKANVPPESVKFWPDTGADAAMMYLTGYIVEIALSADNVFLFVLLMSFFKVPTRFQHRVLFWGVLGALVMRGVMILVGAELIARVHWIIYLFGGFLIFTGVRMLFHDEDAGDPSDNIAVRAVRRFVPVTPDYHGEHFFVRMPASPELAAAGSVSGARLRRYATPLFLVLVCIEFTDLVFAVDSIPAIFGITQDPFIVFTSNVFAILGLRSMYFLLAGVMNRFHYLKIGLSAVLTFVGVKMLLPAAGAWVDKDQMIEKNFSWLFSIDPHGHHHWHIRIPLSLGFIVLTLTASVVASLVWPKAEPDGALPPTDVPDEGEGAHHADIP